MDEQLKGYKERHQSRYIDRENARNNITTTFETHSTNIESATQLKQMEEALKSIESAFKDFPTSIAPPSNIQEKGMNVLNKVNTNTNVKVNFADVNDIHLSKNIENLVKNILEKCGIQSGTMNVEYNMDTSRDEEIARQMQESFGPRARQRPQQQPGRRRTPAPAPILEPSPTSASASAATPPVIVPPPEAPAKPKRGRKPRVPPPPPADTASN